MNFTISMNLLVQGKGKATISLVKLVNNNIAIMIANIYLVCSRNCAKCHMYIISRSSFRIST